MEKNKVVTYEPIKVERIYTSEKQPENTLSVDLTQKVSTSTSYSKLNISSSIQDNFFKADDFTETFSAYVNQEVRRLRITVPDTATLEEVEERLAKYPNATLYKILSNYPILSEYDEKVISKEGGQDIRDAIANRQVVRQSSKQGYKLIYDQNGKVQYRRIGLNLFGNEDRDLREPTVRAMYLTKEIKAEMYGKSYINKNQKI